MQSCRRCFYTSCHPLHLTFDEEGICSGCRTHEEKDVLDWPARGEILRKIFNSYRSHSRRNYDCVVPVSGARDSHFIVHTVKNVYGMNPLLVTYNKHFNTAVGINNLANLRIKFDCDILIQTINPETVKKLTRATLRRFGSIYWHCIAGQTVFPVQIAVRLKIPLVVWGAHQGLDQVGMFSHLDEVEMSRKYRKDHDLMGYEAEDLVDAFDHIDHADVIPYAYPDNKEIEQVGVRGIYLGNYIRWDSKVQHELMIKNYGYQTGVQTRTFDTYHDVDCWNYSDIHDYIKWIKYGYGTVVDHACREIRLGRLTREHAYKLIMNHITKQPRHLGLFLEWLGITKNSFWFLIDQHRSENHWERNLEWEWIWKPNVINKDSIAHLGNDILMEDVTQNPFILTQRIKSADDEYRYILIGKGVA